MRTQTLLALIGSLSFGCASTGSDGGTAGLADAGGDAASGGAMSGAGGTGTSGGSRATGGAATGGGALAPGGRTATGGSSAGGSPESGGAPAAGGAPASDGGPGVDPGAGRITCTRVSAGSPPLTCSLGDLCCAVSGQGSECAATCATGVAIACDGPEDCGGAPCCHGPVGTGTWCATGPACGSGETVLCHDVSDCPVDVATCCARTSINPVGIQICARGGGCF